MTDFPVRNLSKYKDTDYVLPSIIAELAREGETGLMEHEVFKDADFSGLNLHSWSLMNCEFYNCNFDGANLYATCLHDSTFSNCSVNNTVFTKAQLEDCLFEDTDLLTANLEEIKQDLWRVLEYALPEVPGLIQAVEKGRINGQVYDGACACLVGTIANFRGQNPERLDGIETNIDSPIEMFFLNIEESNNPYNHEVSRVVHTWLKEWMATHKEFYDSLDYTINS